MRNNVEFRDKSLVANIVACFGCNNDGQSKIPKHLRNRVVKVDSGGFHTCIISSFKKSKNYNNKLLNSEYSFHYLGCFGNNTLGQSQVPANIAFKVNNVSTGLFSTCVIYSHGMFRCFGKDYFGSITRTSKYHLRPMVITVTAGTLNTCLIHWMGNVECQGANRFGIEKVPEEINSNSSTDKQKLSVNEVVLGAEHACATRYSNSPILFCQGKNKKKQTDVPIQVE